MQMREGCALPKNEDRKKSRKMKKWTRTRHRVYTFLGRPVLAALCHLMYGVRIKRFKEQGGRLADLKTPGVQHISCEQVLETPCTVLALCTVNAIVTEENAHKLQPTIVLECGNAQITAGAGDALESREITIIPDLVATAGGVIVDYFERVQNVQSLIWEQFEVDRMMKSILLKTFDKVWKAAVDHGVSLRMASYVIALEKVCEAKRIRGIFP